MQDVLSARKNDTKGIEQRQKAITIAAWFWDSLQALEEFHITWRSSETKETKRRENTL